MSAPRASGPSAIFLASLGGRPASAELLDDLRKITNLPRPARQHLWELLGPCLGASMPVDIDARVERFCSVYGADAGDLGDAIGAARALIRGAGAVDLASEAFAEDVAQVPGGGELAPLLLAGFEAGKAMVRAELARASLADHGKVLEGVDWRVETIASSHRIRRLGVCVATLTLRYREGEKPGRITLQATPEALRDLYDVCAELLASSPNPSRADAPDLPSALEPEAH